MAGRCATTAPTAGRGARRAGYRENLRDHTGGQRTHQKLLPHYRHPIGIEASSRLPTFMRIFSDRQ
jgi:hypothetical protein